MLPASLPAAITLINDTLFASAGTAYIWYFNGNPVPGGTNAWLVPSATGVYGVAVVDANGCTTLSNAFLYPPNGIQDTQAVQWQAWCANDVLHVRCEVCIDRLEAWDPLGRLIMQSAPRATSTEIQLGTSGVHLVRIEAGDTRLVKRVVLVR